jgi:predicted XRE-type DNA-binding protein
MKKSNYIVTKSAVELARQLGLDDSFGHRWELRNQLVSKIIQATKKAELTHVELAKKVKTSRSRITSILNYNIDDVSTDLLLRILETLGYKISISISRPKMAA